MIGGSSNSVVNVILSDCEEIRSDGPPDIETQDAGYISKKEIAEHPPQNYIHGTPTFLIRHTHMRHRSALTGT